MYLSLSLSCFSYYNIDPSSFFFFLQQEIVVFSLFMTGILASLFSSLLFFSFIFFPSLFSHFFSVLLCISFCGPFFLFLYQFSSLLPFSAFDRHESCWIKYECVKRKFSLCYT
uniref:Uncharacterized protein n=1 Tax=Cacopsylla melanoneura TaxID=428564 RepID=A0A8D8QHM3_9HEMI